MIVESFNCCAFLEEWNSKPGRPALHYASVPAAEIIPEYEGPGRAYVACEDAKSPADTWWFAWTDRGDWKIVYVCSTHPRFEEWLELEYPTVAHSVRREIVRVR
jgi:hypothetical protein